MVQLSTRFFMLLGRRLQQYYSTSADQTTIMILRALGDAIVETVLEFEA